MHRLPPRITRTAPQNHNRFSRLKKFEDGLSARRSVQLNPRFNVSHSFLVAAMMALGREEDAKLSAQRLLALDPTFTIKRIAPIADIEPRVFRPPADAWKAAGIAGVL